jgi:Rrf2 family protein
VRYRHYLGEVITNKSYYGLAALVHLAVAGRERLIGVKEIASNRSLPQRFLELTFSRLRSRGILNATRGAYGGYQLARKPTEISLKEIILACEGLRELTLPDTNRGSLGAGDPIGRTLTNLMNQQLAIMEANLEAVTLSDVIEQSGQAAEMYWI